VSNYTIWGLFGPATWPWWLAVLAFLGSLSSANSRRWPRIFAGSSVAAFLGLAVLPTGYWLAEPLESRFAPPKLNGIEIRHIIVLAGAERLSASARSGRPEVSSAAERIIEGAAVARSIPGAALWIVGGVRDPHSPLADVDWTAASWRRLGTPTHRIQIVRDTLDTCANAAGVAARRPQGQILLVTSALHMPRALACFRQHGLAPIPYPVDYLSPRIDRAADLFQPNLLANIERTDTALHEWLGLLLYRLQGRTGDLLPTP
jgi:uncharacterized SAM-binding protein YcdF (DUF218 family)